MSIQLQVQVSGKNDKTFQKYQDIRWQYRQITMKKSRLIIITLLGLSRPGPRSSTSRLLSVNYWLSEIFRPTLAIISSEPNLQDRQFQARGLSSNIIIMEGFNIPSFPLKGYPPPPRASTDKIFQKTFCSRRSHLVPIAAAKGLHLISKLQGIYLRLYSS